MNLSASMGVSAHTFTPDSAPAVSPAELYVEPPQRRGRPRGSKNYGNQLDYTHFVIWAAGSTHFPMPEDVMTRFGCHKATANRWLNNFASASGRQRPLRNGHGDRVRARSQA